MPALEDALVSTAEPNRLVADVRIRDDGIVPDEETGTVLLLLPRMALLLDILLVVLFLLTSVDGFTG